MDDLTAHSIECPLDTAFAIASHLNASTPSVRLAYAKGRATFTCATSPAALEHRVDAAQIWVKGTRRPASSIEDLASAG